MVGVGVGVGGGIAFIVCFFYTGKSLLSQLITGDTLQHTPVENRHMNAGHARTQLLLTPVNFLLPQESREHHSKNTGSKKG